MSAPTCGELSCDECNARTAALTAERDSIKQEIELVEHRAYRAESMLADPQQLHAHCLRTLNEGQIAHLFGGRMTEIVNRAERAEADAAAYLKRAESFRKIGDEAEAELATERGRLDWLESPAGVDWQWSSSALTIRRAVIDAAMKEDAK